VRLHVITDDAVLARPDFVRRGRELLDLADVPVALHLRGPRTSARRLLELGQELGAAPGDRPGTLLVNDRVDVAMLLDSGVHLAARSLPVAEARRLRGDAALVGRSVRVTELAEVGEPHARLDYLLMGTIFATPSHPERPGDGLAALRAAARGAGDPGLPMIGIGGITPDRVAPVLQAGAHGVAVLSGIWDGPSPAEAARVYAEALKNALESMGDKT
jgi:thiamine-phosphate diphosphorylase